MHTRICKYINIYVCVLSCSVVSNFCDPMDCSPPGSSVDGIVQARVLEWVAIFLPRVLPNPGIETGSPVLQADFTD